MSKIFFNCCICLDDVNSIFSAVWMVIPGFCWNQRKEKAEHNDSQFGKPECLVLLLLFWSGLPHFINLMPFDEEEYGSTWIIPFCVCDLYYSLC